MSDFEMMCDMYDRAKVEYKVVDKVSFNVRDIPFSKAIEVGEESNARGYGDACYHVFDEQGNLITLYIW